MLPGVELARMRRLHHHETKQRWWLKDAPVNRPEVVVDNSTMDASALVARGRLEEKLRRFRGSRHRPPPPPRSNQIEFQTNSSSRRVVLQRKESVNDVCAVCLDAVVAQPGGVTRLPCSHRYHSDCLRPWLEAHSNCPCCRTTVPCLPLLSN